MALRTLNWCLRERLTTFGLFAVTLMLVTYTLEKRSPWYIFAFGISCWLGSVYGFLQGAWPFGLVEDIWGIVAFVRFRNAIPKFKVEDE